MSKIAAGFHPSAIILLSALWACDAPEGILQNGQPEEGADTTGSIVCTDVVRPPGALSSARVLVTKTNEEIWAEYRYNHRCVEDEALEAAALDELVRRGDSNAMYERAPFYLYNDDLSDDEEGVALLEHAASLGHRDAREWLEMWRQQHGR